MYGKCVDYHFHTSRCLYVHSEGLHQTLRNLKSWFPLWGKVSIFRYCPWIKFDCSKLVSLQFHKNFSLNLHQSEWICKLAKRRILSFVLSQLITLTLNESKLNVNNFEMVFSRRSLSFGFQQIAFLLSFWHVALLCRNDKTFIVRTRSYKVLRIFEKMWTSVTCYR